MKYYVDAKIIHQNAFVNSWGTILDKAVWFITKGYGFQV
jgi:hypothetical protein